MIKRSCRYRVVVFAKCKKKSASPQDENKTLNGFSSLSCLLSISSRAANGFQFIMKSYDASFDSHSCNCFWIWILVLPLYQLLLSLLLLFCLALCRISSSSSLSLFVFSKCIALFIHCLAFLCPSTLSFFCGGKNGTRCLVTFPVLRPWKNFP